jgi:PAS domain S-box-containing protein
MARGNAGLAKKVRLVAFGLASLVVIILGAVVLVTTVITARTTFETKQAATLKVLAGNIQSLLNRRIDTMHDLSVNPLIWTAISDTVGRETNLRPYLRNLNSANTGIEHATLLDYRGRLLSGGLSAHQLEEAHLNTLINNTLGDGQPKFQYDLVSGELHAWVGFPVRYPYTDDVIGVLLGRISIHDDLTIQMRALEQEQGFTLISSERELFDSIQRARRFDATQMTIAHPGYPNLYQLDVLLYATRSIWLDNALRMALVLLLAGILVIWLVWRISGRLVKTLTFRLERLSVAVAVPRPTSEMIPMDGAGDELDQLAIALRRAIEDYERLAGDLESTIVQRTRTLTESEERYRQSFEVNTAIKLVIDPISGAIIDANSAAIEFYGYAREVLLSMQISQINCLSADEIHEEMEHAVREERKFFHFLHKLANGQIRDVEVYSGPATVGGKALLYSIIHDVTERKRAESALIEAKLAAESANLAKSQFLATMSHEIRTPLNGVLGMAQMLLMDDVSAEERKDYARTIVGSGQTLLALLNDVLDLAKVEAGRLTIESREFSPEGLINNLHSLFHEAARQKQLEFRTAWHGELPARVTGDPHRLQQMLSNLVSNALKFTQQGHIEIAGRLVEMQHDHTLLEFAVTDTGIGIAQDKLGLLFKPFSQADSSTTRQFGGTGLGLSIVRSLAQAMGGDVGVDSIENQGSRFWFRIKAGRVPDAVNRGDDSPALAQDPTLRLGQEARIHGHILVVEDVATNRKVIDAALTRLGLHVSMAEDGQQGVDFVKRDTTVDLVLMDIHMPVMDGYQATQCIREWERSSARTAIPIVALTADAYDSDRERALSCGMSDFLAKPVDLHALIHLLLKYLPHDVKQTAIGPVISVPIDVEALRSRMRELAELLKHGKVSARTALLRIHDLIQNTELANEFATVDRLVEDLRFAAALDELQRISGTRGWSLESP